jgi:hypothetical protein
MPQHLYHIHLRSHFVTSNKGPGGRRSLPYAFTEEGVAMLSSVLRSARAIKVNNAIMRTFVRLRLVFISQKDLARTLDEIEQKLGEHDHNFQVVFEAIRQLMHPPVPHKSCRIGLRLN